MDGGRDQLDTHCTIGQAAREKIWTGPPPETVIRY